jgi:DNA-binding PadR family transcriptional regulator
MHHRNKFHRPGFEHMRHQRNLRRRRGRGGPRAARGDIKSAILALLEEEPMHGYEMIKEIEERSGGAWSPSPGSIYPTLQMLEEQGLVTSTEADGRRRFALTDSGREARSEHDAKPPWEEVRDEAGREALSLQQALRKINHAVAQGFHAADEEQQRKIAALLDETRRKVYGVLAETDPA